MTMTPPSVAAPANDAAWVALAVFTQPHGVSGRMKVKSFTDPVGDFARHPNLTDDRGNPVKLRVTGSTNGGVIVEIEGVTRREQADVLRGRKLGIPRTSMPALTNPNMYYTDDLIGMEVCAADGSLFGHVRNVANYGAGDILDISRPTGGSELYAFTHATFPVVDAAARRITIHPPEIWRATPDEA